jgi:septal ring factor EnvC (AmiA/AmiB activator)
MAHIKLIKAHSMKALFLLVGLFPLSGISQVLVKNTPVDNKTGAADRTVIAQKQKTLSKEISNLVELTKTQLTQIASLQNQLADRKTKLQSIDKKTRTAEEETTFQNLQKEIQDLEIRIKKLDSEKEETNRKITTYQKELSECDKQVGEICLNKAAGLFGRTQILLDSLPPSERKLDPLENLTLDYYYTFYKSSPVFQQKVKQYWKANMRTDEPDPFTKAKERKNLSPELQQALRERIKECLTELNSLQQETASVNHRY